jgi:D-alanine-D-alanine ligase
MKQKIETVAILHQNVSADALPDELDVLVQVRELSDVLVDLGYGVKIVPVDETFEFVNDIKQCDKVFNLVETFKGRADKSHVVPLILELKGIPFTGSGSNAVAVTTDKVLTKSVLSVNSIITPEWYTSGSSVEFKSGKYIFKPVSEDASVGITQENLCEVTGKADADKMISKFQECYGIPFFCERYIAGREFNVSVTSLNGKPKVFHPAEIVFLGEDEENQIVDYNAKWDEDSEDYKNSVRSFSEAKEDRDLYEQLKQITAGCWEMFKLKGYARVDFRVDRKGVPYVIEVNANPCLSSDGGFAAAVSYEGFSFSEVIRIILKEAANENKK